MTDDYLYLKIADGIRRDIISGTYQVGDDLPSVRELKESWHCTIGTVQRAMHKLAEEGLVICHVGKRTEVIAVYSAKPADSLRRANLIHQAETFLLDLLTAGYTPAEAEDSLRIAMERWRNVSKTISQINHETLRFAGSHDLVTAWIATHFDEISPGYKIHLNFTGSLNGLLALVEKKTEIAGAHLWDVETETYNLPYVQKIFPSEKMALITLANRRIGWFVKPGNPKNFTGFNDLTRQDIRFVNRIGGSGTRVFLDSVLKKNDINADKIQGYPTQKLTHNDVASEVSENRADVGLGMEASARLYHLDFIFENLERYDLVLRQELLEATPVKNLISWLKSEQFSELLDRFHGYDASESGKVQLLN